MGILKRRMNKIVQDVDSMKVDFQDALEEKGIEEPGNSLPAYPEKILEIEQGGGGGGEVPYNMNRIRYFDYDGTLLKEEVVADGQSSTPPANRPNIAYPALTFVGWSAKTADLSAIYCDMDVIAEYEVGSDWGAAFFVDVPAGGTLRPPLYGNSGTYLVKWTAQDADWTSYSASGASHTYSEGYRGWVLMKLGTASKFLVNTSVNADYVKIYAPVAGIVNDTTTSSYVKTFWPDLEGIYVPKSSQYRVHNMHTQYTPLLRWIYYGATGNDIMKYATIFDGEFVIAPYAIGGSWLPMGNYKTAFVPTGGGMGVSTSNTGALWTATISSLYCPKSPLSFGNGSMVITRHLFCQSINGSASGRCAPQKLVILCNGSSTETYGNNLTNNTKLFILQIDPSVAEVTISAAMWPTCAWSKIILPAGSTIKSGTSNINVYTIDESFWRELFTMLSAPSGAATLNIPSAAYSAISAETKAIATDKGYSVAQLT